MDSDEISKKLSRKKAGIHTLKAQKKMVSVKKKINLPVSKTLYTL